MSRSAWRGLAVLILVAGVGWAYATRPQSGATAPASASTRVGAPAPEITLLMLSGETRTLTDLRGKVVVLNFWATWCGPCRAEMPALAEIQTQYASRGVIVIGVNQREDAGSIRRYLDSIGVDFQIALDPMGESNRQYRVLGLPTTYLIDRQGVIRDAIFGGPMSRALIESKLAPLLEP
ncbi:MAG: TlpA disulfide reductase family protein [Thermoflexales bacterium]